jgi:hypothetical protein
VKRANEIVSYFKCKACDKFWRIVDAPEDKKSWFCPWCGLGQMEDPEHKPQDVPAWDQAQELKKTLEEASKELEKLFGEFGDIFKKK